MQNVEQQQAKAMFAGGCFWCMEAPFEKMEGVYEAVAGYAGGTTANPTYEHYHSGGHIEVVEVTYDPEKITYEQLLGIFWQQIDPTDQGGQFVDRGHGYSTAIFYYDDAQRVAAEKSKKQLATQNIFTKPIVTPILPAPAFYPAEDYHQDYYLKNPTRYKMYRFGSGRENFLKRIWSKE